MDPRRSLPLLLLPLGVGLTHTLAYRLAHPATEAHAQALDGHGHLSVIAIAGVAMLTVALATAIVRGRAGRGTVTVRLPVLAGLQVVAFLGLECGERLGSGTLPSLAGDPAVHLGVALGAGVAVALRSLLGAAAWVAAAVGPVPALAPCPALGGSVGSGRTPSVSPLPAATLGPIRWRAPPCLLVTSA